MGYMKGVPGHFNGTTPSEKFLARLARSTFLSLWSYSNLYTDEGRKGCKGVGKELADLLVVFGDHLLIFSDKHCAFPGHPDINVSWRRWYASAVEKSARQLIGAKRWLERFPERVFKDSRCTMKLPIPLPPPGRAKVHLIAVTRGSYEACRQYFGGDSTGSLIVLSDLRGKDHYYKPFCIGHVALKGPFVHVLDEMTVEVLLNEFDTISDLANYLDDRQEFLSTADKVIVSTGEEELVAAYSMRIDEQGNHSFPELTGDAEAFMFKEGGWNDFRDHPRYRAKKKADMQSYAWDQLIELLIETGESLDGSSSEPFLRTMAGESRLSRRVLAEQMIRAFHRELPPTQRYVITTVSSKPPNVVYVFVALPAPFGCDTYEEYCELRRAHLVASCYSAKLLLQFPTKFVGIAREPMSHENGTYEAICLDVGEGPLTPDFEREVQEMQDNLGVSKEVVAQLRMLPTDEFPNPDESDDGLSSTEDLSSSGESAR